MTPRVSVVISSYQAEPYIETAIRSALDQDFDDFELLVQDDASTDGTVAIARSFHDPRLRVEANQANAGAVSNFNRGIARTTGEAVVKVDADDYLLPGFLSNCYRCLRSDPELSFIFTAAQAVSLDGSCAVHSPWSHDRKLTGREFLITSLTNGNPCPSCTVMFRRAAFAAVGGFQWPVPSPPFGEDFVLWLRMALLGSVAYIGKPLAAHRSHSCGLTARLANPAHRQPLRYREQEIELILDAAARQGILLSGDARDLRTVMARRWMFAADACAFLPSDRNYCLRNAWRLSHAEVARSRHLWRMVTKVCVGRAVTEKFRELTAGR